MNGLPDQHHTTIVDTLRSLFVSAHAAYQQAWDAYLVLHWTAPHPDEADIALWRSRVARFRQIAADIHEAATIYRSLKSPP